MTSTFSFILILFNLNFTVRCECEAERSYAAINCPSVRPSVCKTVTLRYIDHNFTAD